MSPLVKNILAIVVGWAAGSMVNMGLIQLGMNVIPLPEGMTMDAESMQANMHLFQPKNFIFPFLAHALGTFVGAYVATKMAVNRKRNIALGIGFIFLLGGIAMVRLIPAPTWFSALDLIVAYLPMAWLGWKLGSSGDKGLA